MFASAPKLAERKRPLRSIRSYCINTDFSAGPRYRPCDHGRALVAAVMFETDDPVHRAATLSRLGGIENNVFLELEGERILGAPDPTRENTSPQGKASAVQFLRFSFTNYQHMAILSEPLRAALAEDFD